MSKIIKQYLKLFENLNIENINKFEYLLDKDIVFIDPFNKIKGREQFIKLFKRNLEIIKNPKFIITTVTSVKNIYFVKWRMEYFAFGKTQSIDGVSEIKLNKLGLIIYHYDHWDSFNQFYLKLPFLGKVLKLLYNFIKLKI